MLKHPGQNLFQVCIGSFDKQSKFSFYVPRLCTHLPHGWSPSHLWMLSCFDFYVVLFSTIVWNIMWIFSWCLTTLNCLFLNFQILRFLANNCTQLVSNFYQKSNCPKLSNFLIFGIPGSNHKIWSCHCP